VGTKVLILGGGFGGIATALELTKKNKVVLVSDKPHFEYHAALYRVVTGRSPLEVCIPIPEILKDTGVEFVVDTITEIDIDRKIALGVSESKYKYDYLVMAVGSEVEYFNIPGLAEYSFGFKSISEALILKKHLHTLFERCKKIPQDEEEQMCLLHIAVIGAGASGVELSGELACYMKKLAKKHEVDESLITIDLIEAQSRILPLFPTAVAKKVTQRLRSLGVNVFINRPMSKGEIEKVTVRGMTMRTETIIWTAGIKPNSLHGKIEGLEVDKKGKVVVDKYLLGAKNFFVIGDGASTKYSGMAQTAIYEGALATKNILNDIKGKKMEEYKPKKPYYSIPVGPGWAATLVGPLTFYGLTGWFLRRMADLRYFLSILPLGKALTAFQSGQRLSENCEICKRSTD
jgi:NADH dehydrogenase